MATKDYSSIYTIKEFALNELAPKYFEMDDINQLNIGLFGYTTELIANTTEDSFNAVSTYINEIFPNKAVIPESIYNYAALFQLDNLFSNPSEMDVMLFISEADIVRLGTKLESMYEFVIDSNMVIDVEGKQFMLDYDIIINCKPYRGDYIFTATYDKNFNNSISDIVNPYIKLRRVKYSNTNYIGMFVKVRRVNRFEQTEYIISNDKINLPSVSFQFNDKLANFEVFYKSPQSKNYVQMSKKLISTPALKTPFCYYKFKDKDIIELSFSAQDGYFQPEFNSEVLIRYYTTSGVDGNFPLYTGTGITVIPKSDTYIYNNNVVMFAVIQSESVNGTDSLSLEELRNIIVEKFSTVDSYTNENDLQIYFNNLKYKYGNDVQFIKKRDDVFERLFSAYALIKDDNKDIYSTNTLAMNLLTTDFDLEYAETNTYILKAGHVFTYADGSSDTVQIVPGITVKDDLSTVQADYKYSLPFLTTVTKVPGIVGYYVNSINMRIPLEYTYVNSDSIMQFICNSIYVTRNALKGEDTYKLTVLVSPTSDLDTPLVDMTTGTDLGILKLMATVYDSGVETCRFDFHLVGFDPTTRIYAYEADITTDDYMTLDMKFRALNATDIITGESIVKLIPMVGCVMNIYAFYKYDDNKIPHRYDYIPELQPYTMTNMYTTLDETVSFIVPLTMMRSKMKYTPIDDTNFSVNVSSVPFVQSEVLQNTELYAYFMQNLTSQYQYMQDTLDKITNNYGIDLKFYNTYGKSKNFVVGEDHSLLDSVNCKIKFKVAPTVGADEETLTRDIKIFIKNYIEGINDKGSNAIYVSNLIQALENNFSEIKYLKFININNYDSSVQVIENRTVDLNQLSKDDRINYVPEYLTIKLDDIIIDIIH